MELAFLDRLTDLALHETVRAVHHAFREVALPVEGLRARKALAERQPGKTEDGQREETYSDLRFPSPQRWRRIVGEGASTACLLVMLENPTPSGIRTVFSRLLPPQRGGEGSRFSRLWLYQAMCVGVSL